MRHALLPWSIAVAWLALAGAPPVRAQDDRVEALLREVVGEEGARKLRYVPVTPPPRGGRAEAPHVRTPADDAPVRAAYARHRAELDTVLALAARPDADGAPLTGRLLAERLTGDLRDRLTRAAMAIHGAGGDDAPRLLKPLVRDGSISREHSALLWLARDTMIREAVRRVEAALRAEHPRLKLHLTILDSGTYGTVGSDVDKTPHVRIEGAPPGTPAFGPGGTLGDPEAFVRRFYDALDAVGRERGAQGAAHKALDTEFFAPDTLPERLGASRSTAEGVAPLRAAVDRMDARFVALQRNPGPSYQFDEAVVLQVLGRVVEADEALGARRAALAAERERAGGAPSVTLLLDEAVAHVHGAAVAIEPDGQGGSRAVPIAVREFLQQAGLAVRYDRRLAAGVALGNLEKLVHKRQRIVDATGRFDDASYMGHQVDIAKCGSRILYDLATAFIDDPDRPASEGEFGRRFGPADAHGRPVNPGERPYTRAVHEQVLQAGLARLHGDAPDAAERAARDLDLFWAVRETNDLLLAQKKDPSRRTGSSDPLAPLAAVLAQRQPERWRDVRPDERAATSHRLHAEATERMGFTLAAAHVRLALDAWIGPRLAAREQYDHLRERLERQAVGLQQELDLARAGAADDPQAGRRVDALEDDLKRTRDELERVTTDPASVKADLEAAGLNLARRLFLLFHAENPAEYRRIVEQLPPQHRAALEVMNGVFRGQAEERARVHADACRRLGLDPAKVRGPVGAEVLSRLGRSYMEAYGVDVDAYFGARGGDANAPGEVLRRFAAENLVGLGGASSTLNLARVLQQNAKRPLPERLAAAGSVVVDEVAGSAPGLGNVLSIYKGLAAGDPRAATGGALQLGSEVAQMWIERLAEDAVVGAGRQRALATLSGLGGQLTILLQLARTSVELVGHEAFEPIRDDLAALALTGVVPARRGGLIAAGNREVRGDLPIDPIVMHDAPPAFLWLRRDRAEELGRWLEAHDAQAAEAFRELPELAPDKGGNVLVDLATPCAELARRGRARDLAAGESSVELADLRARARDVACAHLDLYARLQTAVRARLAEDERAHRAGERDPDSLWLLALRENLGLALDAQFTREAQLLLQRLLERPARLTEARDQLARDAEAAWTTWRAQAQGVDEAAAREQFLLVMSPLARWDAALAAARAQAQLPAPPEGWLTGAIERRALAWLGRGADARQAGEARLAALTAFSANRYADGRPHTAPYARDEALAWFDRRIATAYQEGAPAAEREALVAERGLLEAGFSEADAAVAPKLAHLRLMDWLAGAPPFSEAQAALRFLWHDLDTQARIRGQLVTDLVRSRRLVPAVRAHGAVLASLVDASMRSALKDREDRLEAALVDAMEAAAGRVDGAVDDLDAEVDLPLPAPALRVRPWLRMGRARGGVELELVTEGELVGPPRDGPPQVQLEARAVPLDGEDGPALRAALAAAGVDEAQVALALRFDGRAGETRAEPAYLLLLGEARPAVGRGKLAVHPLRRGADPAAGPAAVDPGERRLLGGEPLVLLLDPELPADAGFDWQVRAGATTVSGAHVPGHDLSEGFSAAPSGAGLPLARLLPPLGPGTHEVSLRPHAVGALAGVAREWRAVGTFEVRPLEAELLGFVGETAAVGLPAFPGRVDVGAKVSGARVELSLEATCRVGDAGAASRRATLELELPSRLSLRDVEVARVSWSPIPGERPAPAALTAALLPLRHATTTTPTRALLDEPGVGAVRLEGGRADGVLPGERFRGVANVEAAPTDVERVAAAWRLRDGVGLWYLPIRVTWGACTAYGFAAYGKPGAAIAAPPAVPRAPPLEVALHGGGTFAAGDQVDLRAEVRGGTPDAVVTWRVNGADVPGARARVVLRAKRHGTFKAGVRAVDAVGREATAGAGIDVTAGPGGPTFDVVVDGPARATQGVPVRLAARVRGGGRGPFRTRWTVAGAPHAGAVIEVGFGLAGKASVTVEVQDAGGQRAVATHVVEVAALPLRLEGELKRELDVGQTARGTVKITGGRPPYRVTWGIGGAWYEGDTLSLTLAEVGEYPVTVVARDSSTPPRQVVSRTSVRVRRPLPPPPPTPVFPPDPGSGGGPGPSGGWGGQPVNATYSVKAIGFGELATIRIEGHWDIAYVEGGLGFNDMVTSRSGDTWRLSSSAGGFVFTPFEFTVTAQDPDDRVFVGTCRVAGGEYECQVVKVGGR